MMKGNLDGRGNSAPISLTVNDLPLSFVGSGYNVYIYFDANTESFSDTIARYELKSDSRSQVFFGVNSSENYGDSGAYVQATATTLKEATPPGNYFLFTGWTNANLTLTAYGTSGDIPRASVQGIQIVARSALAPNRSPTAADDTLTAVNPNTSKTPDCDQPTRSGRYSVAWGGGDYHLAR